MSREIVGWNGDYWTVPALYELDDASVLYRVEEVTVAQELQDARMGGGGMEVRPIFESWFRGA